MRPAFVKLLWQLHGPTCTDSAAQRSPCRSRRLQALRSSCVHGCLCEDGEATGFTVPAGHIVSTDLVHWERQPPALVPDTEYDYDGVFSGSATILEDGTPYLFFTGRQILKPSSCSRSMGRSGHVRYQERLWSPSCDGTQDSGACCRLYREKHLRITQCCLVPSAHERPEPGPADWLHAPVSTPLCLAESFLVPQTHWSNVVCMHCRGVRAAAAEVL